MIDNTQEILKFMPYSSCINPSFWFELSRTKLEDLKLDDSFKLLFGYFSNCTSCDLPPIVNFDYSSFDKLVSMASLIESLRQVAHDCIITAYSFKGVSFLII